MYNKNDSIVQQTMIVWPTLAKDSIIIFHNVLLLTIFQTFYDYSCLANTLIIRTAAKFQGKTKLQTFD